MLVGLAALPLVGRATAAKGIPGRVATVDWALLETLLALDSITKKNGFLESTL